MKKIISTILIIVLGIALIGCQKKETPVPEEAAEKSEYTVTSLEKPEGIQYIRFLTYLDNGTLRIGGTDQTWEKHTVWDSQNDGKDWTLAEDLSNLENTDIRNVFYKYSSDKRLYTADSNAITINDGNTQVTVGLEGKGICLDSVLSEDTLYALIEDSSGIKQIWKYDLSKSVWELFENEELLNTTTEANGYGCLAIDSSDKNLYTEGTGIIRYNPENDEISTLINQEELNNYIDVREPITALAVHEGNTVICTSDSSGDSNNLYLVTERKNDESKKASDKNENTSLEIYSLKENFMIRNSLALFRRTHADIPVTYTIGYTGEDGLSISDAIRKLNTEIMAGEGPDILILDNLPIEEYVSKGILEPVTDVIEDMREELFFNMIEGCNSGNEIYAVPTTFQIPVVVGNSSILSLNDVNEMLQYVAGENSPVMSAQNFPIAAAKMFVAMDIVNETEIDRDKLTSYYNNLLLMKELSHVTNKTEEYFDYSMEQAAELFPHQHSDVGTDIYFGISKFGVTDISNGDSYLYLNSAAKQADIAFDYVNKNNGHYYIPTEILGINSMSTAKDAAKEFLMLYLSSEVQDTNTIGFSINKTSMRNGVRITEEPVYATTLYQNMGDASGLNVNTLTPSEFDELLRFIELADTPAQTDAVVMDAVMEQADKILYEGVDVETAVAQVCEKMDLYLKE